MARRLERLRRAAAGLPLWGAVRRAARRVTERRPAEEVAAEEVRVRSEFWPKLRRNLGRLPFAVDLVAAWYAMLDPMTPTTARAVLIGALAYFIVPTDVIPDVLIGTGFLDDATVLGFALQTVQRHIRPIHRVRALETLGREAAPEAA
jgi:uncharacterized membrane protein YkvA (DUF1232 family)